MDGTKIFLVIFVVLSTITSVFAVNCYGGSIVQTTVVGGSSGADFLDLTSSNNRVYAGGNTYSSNFPYNFSYLYSGTLYPAMATLTSVSTSNDNYLLNGVISSIGFDQTNSLDADGDYLCVVGYTSSASTFPASSPYSNYSNTNAAFLWVFNTSTGSPNQLYSELVGDDFSTISLEQRVACSAKHQTAFVVSTSGYLSKKRELNDYDIRVTFVNLTDGMRLSDLYFGSVGLDERTSATDFFEKGNDKFLLLVGTTLASGISDNIPIANAFQNVSAGSWETFVWVANVNDYKNITWQFATFFGGNGSDQVCDAVFDESGNVYIVGTSYSPDLPMKNALNSTYIGMGYCYLAIFNLQGELLMSTWLDFISNYLYIDVSRLTDSGHLLYLTAQTFDMNATQIEGFQYNITNQITNTQDSFIKIFYISPQFTSASVRLYSLFGGSNDDYTYGITVLPNNSFAIAGYSGSPDLPQARNYSGLSGDNAFITVFQCGSGLYAVNPSPTPAASIAPSPPAVTCQATDGCYSAPGIVVQFQQGDDGEYTPSQTVFAGTDNDIHLNYYLNVQYLTLEEKDVNGNLTVSVPFPTSGYSLTSETQIINNVTVDVVTFSTSLVNGAGVDVINYFFTEAGTLDFAGNVVPVGGVFTSLTHSVTYQESTSKVSLNISGWNFENTANTVTLTILMDISPPPKGEATSSTSGNQTQFSWDTGATNCIVSTLSAIEIDSTTGVATANISDTQIEVTFPYFADYVLYDPGYTVLVKDDKSSSPKQEISPWAYVGAALGAMVVVGVVVAIGYIIMSRNRRKIKKALSFKKNEEEMKQLAH